MKSFSRLILSITFVAFMANGLDGEDEYKVSDNEELFGAWVLIDYKDGTPPKRVTIKPGGYDGFYPADAMEPMWTAEYAISDKWTDAEGNVWYKVRWVIANINGGFSLYKISESGKILEQINSQWEYPKELDANSEYYRVYYRK